MGSLYWDQAVELTVSLRLSQRTSYETVGYILDLLDHPQELGHIHQPVLPELLQVLNLLQALWRQARLRRLGRRGVGCRLVAPGMVSSEHGARRRAKIRRRSPKQKNQEKKVTRPEVRRTYNERPGPREQLPSPSNYCNIY